MMNITESGLWLDRFVQIPSDRLLLDGQLQIPSNARGLVLFAHGSGSSRHSPRNQSVARAIRASGVGTLLFDLLTSEEEEIDRRTRCFRFDIDFLARRLLDATVWGLNSPDLPHLRLGYFGASTGAAAALVAAAALGPRIGTVVSRGGRPDLAGDALARVVSPTLLIVGGLDEFTMEVNEKAFHALQCEKELRIVPGATHLFEETGTLEEVSRLACDWFFHFLQSQPAVPGANSTKNQ